MTIKILEWLSQKELTLEAGVAICKVNVGQGTFQGQKTI